MNALEIYRRSQHCLSHAHCNQCRNDPVWRQRVGAPDECPEGYTADKIPSRGLGDTLAKITKAIGIKPCEGCQNRIEWANRKVPYGIPPYKGPKIEVDKAAEVG